MTPNVSPSQLHLAVGGSGVLARMIVDGSALVVVHAVGRPKSIERPLLLFSCFAMLSWCASKPSDTVNSLRPSCFEVYGGVSLAA